MPEFTPHRLNPYRLNRHQILWLRVYLKYNKYNLVSLLDLPYVKYTNSSGFPCRIHIDTIPVTLLDSLNQDDFVK